MPLVELNENECAFVRDGTLCRANSSLGRPPTEVNAE